MNAKNEDILTSVGTIHHGDCIEGMHRLPEGSVDLAKCLPKFNVPDLRATS